MDSSKRQISIKDIANISGVSIATVSRVLNHKGKYSAETEQKVLAIADSYGYVSNMAAKSLRQSKSKTIGLLLPNINNTFFSTLAYYIETYLFSHDYSVFICNSGNDSQKEREYFHTLISKGVDGILCISDLDELPDELTSRNIPILCIDRQPKAASAIPWVGNDDVYAGMLATNHLLDQGRKHILFISSYIPEYNRHSRQTGYENALTAHNMLVDKNYILKRHGDDPTPIEVEILVYEFLQKGFPVDGIVASSEPAALGAVYALRRSNLSIPEDVALISFDNSIYSLLTAPPISSIERNPQQLANTSCDVLLKMIDGTVLDKMNYTIPVQLIARESTGTKTL